jgi:adenylate cyclase
VVFAILIGLIWTVWPRGTGQQSESAAEESTVPGPTVFVLPFQAVSDAVDEVSVGKGISIDIANMLSQFPELRVYPVGPTFPSSGLENYGKRHNGSELHFILSGNVQIIDDDLRITARLQKAFNRLQVWSERYDSAFLPEQIFLVQESIASNVTRKLAEPFGLLRKFSRNEIKELYNPSLEAYRCVLVGYEYRQKFSAELHSAARACLENATKAEPDYARAWALLAYIYVDEYRFFYNSRPSAHTRAVEAAQRAVLLNPEDVLSYQALSVALFGNGDIERALDAGRKAVALNPHNNEALIQLGYRTGAAGNWQEGIMLAEKAISESPAPPAWYHWVPALYH